MCSVLIFVKPDNDHHDPLQDWKKFKAGDVIDIQDDDAFDWGGSVQGPDALGWWKVVTVTGATKKDLAGLMSSDPLPLASLDELSRAEVPHRIRTQTIDVSKLKKTMTKSQFLSIVSMKPELHHPASIGHGNNVIG